MKQILILELVPKPLLSFGTKNAFWNTVPKGSRPGSISGEISRAAIHPVTHPGPRIASRFWDRLLLSSSQSVADCESSNPFRMRTYFAAALVLSAGMAMPSGIRAQEKESFSPRVESVTVYPDRVLVTRSMTLDLSPGKHLLVFENASPNLDPASLRGFSDDTSVIVQGVSTYVERRIATVDSGIRELESKLKDLEKERSRQQARTQRAQRDLTSIQQYADYLTKTISDQSARTDGDVSRWNESLALLAKRRLQARLEEQQAEEELGRLAEAISIATANLDKVRTASEKMVRVVEITLQTSAAKKVRVGFSYIMGGASWLVSYGFYMQPDGKILVEYYGNVKQQTGEEWTDAEISLSTSTPSHGAERPGISPVYVGAREVKTKEGYKQTEQAAQEAETGEPAPTSADTGGYANIEDTGRSLVFRIPRRATVPSSDRSYRMTIARFSLQPRDTAYRLVAGVQRAAHLTARLANDRPFPLLAGPADSYRSSGFVGRTAIDYTPSGAAFLVGFGVDRTIRVRRDVRTFQEKAGPFTKNRIYRTTIDVVIGNDSSAEKDVNILERVPVSDVDSVKIRIRPETTAGYSEEKERSGIFKWTVHLKPGEKRTITLSFEAEVPGDFPGDLFGR